MSYKSPSTVEQTISCSAASPLLLRGESYVLFAIGFA